MKNGDPIYALVKIGVDLILERPKADVMAQLTRLALDNDGDHFNLVNFAATPVGAVNAQIIFEVVGTAIEKEKPAPVVEVPTPPVPVNDKKDAKKNTTKKVGKTSKRTVKKNKKSKK